MRDTKHAAFLEQARESISNERDEEQLARQEAELVSRRATTFAKRLGHADVWTVKTSENPHECREQPEIEENSAHEGSKR
jgi:hypothetical protein